MSDFTSKSLWYLSFRHAGFTKASAEHFSALAVSQIERDIAPIVSVEHFAALVGLDIGNVQHMLGAPEHFYRTYAIPKRRGGLRTIEAPVASLLQCQRWILANILARIPLDESVHGFVPGRSIFSNARLHLGHSDLIRIDIQDFFPTITLRRVVSQFVKCGFAGRIARFLGLLCTYHNQLPQGAATSPALANLVCRVMDARLKGLAATSQLTYTRYADDLVFSGPRIGLSFARHVQGIIVQSGFRVNSQKTMLIRGTRRRKVVTGLLVSDDQLKLPKPTRRRWRTELHKLCDPDSALNRLAQDPLCIDRAIGRATFWLQAEPHSEYPRRMLERLKGVKRQLLEQ